MVSDNVCSSIHFSNPSIAREVVVLQMEDIKNLKVVEHNDLIRSIAKMDNKPLKLFELAVAAIDKDKAPVDNTVYISKKVFFSFFEGTSNSKYTGLKNAVLELHSQAIFEIRKMSDDESYKFVVMSPIVKTEWGNREDIIAIKFSEEVMPYLIDLKKNFTQYDVENILKLDKKYSIALYKWLVMNFNEYKYYKNSTTTTDKQKEKRKNPIISIRELREITNTQKKYKRNNNIEPKILKEQIEEINAKTNLIVTYERLYAGVQLVGFKFYISEKQIKKDITAELLPTLSKAEREQRNNDLFNKAFQSKYTDELTDTEKDVLILKMKDIKNRGLMIELQESVYPLYENFENQYGYKLLEKHFDYLRTQIINGNGPHTNIAGWLKTNITNYTPRVIKD